LSSASTIGNQAHQGAHTMLYYAIVFLIIALIAGFFGFFGVAGLAAGIAKILFVIFIILFIVSLIFGRRRYRPSVVERRLFFIARTGAEQHGRDRIVDAGPREGPQAAEGTR
jgi:uncharacterized membrane protein YtjA (UPF0391 family)